MLESRYMIYGCMWPDNQGFGLHGCAPPFDDSNRIFCPVNYGPCPRHICADAWVILERHVVTKNEGIPVVGW